jgi:hypothetical protein
MTGTTFFSGLSLLTTAELVGMSGGALPACFTPLPVTRGSTADSLRDAGSPSTKPTSAGAADKSQLPGSDNTAGAAWHGRPQQPSKVHQPIGR